MTVVSGDILRTTQSFILGDGTVCQNIFHHQRHGIGILADSVHLDVIENWVEAMYAEIAAMVKNDVAIDIMTVDFVEWVVDRWEVTGLLGTRAPTFTPLGTADMLPNQSSAFATFKTSRPKTVGRKFLLPFEEAWQAGSFLLPGAVTDMVAWADDAVNDIDVDFPTDWLAPGVIRTGVDSWLEFTLAIITNVLGSQRRRRPGEGA